MKKWMTILLPVLVLALLAGKTFPTAAAEQGASAEQFALYTEDGRSLGDYADWKAVVDRINAEKQKTVVYRVVVPTDLEINGAWKMPQKGKYAGLLLESSKTGGKTSAEGALSIHATGKLALTADLTVGPGIALTAKGITGGSNRLVLGAGSQLTSTAAITVGEFVLEEGTSLSSAGKLTVKKTLYAADDVTVTLTEKKGASVKHTELAGEKPVQVLVQSAAGMAVSLAQDTTLMSVTGDSYPVQYALRGADGSNLPLYRKGNTLRVLGARPASVVLYEITADRRELGEFLTLANVKTEINRRKDKAAVYEVEIRTEQFVKGALPLPGANKYSKLWLHGADVRMTGNVSLTGELVLESRLYKVKSINNLTICPMTVKLSKYRLVIPAGYEPQQIGSVSGAAGSVLDLGEASAVTVNGNLKAEHLVLGGTLTLGGTLSVTNVTYGPQNRLNYDIAKKTSISGVVCEAAADTGAGTGAKLVLAPYKGGSLLTAFTNGMRLLFSVPQAEVEKFALLQNTDYVVYRDKNVLKLGVPVIVLFEGTTDYASCHFSGKEAYFVTFSDMMEHVVHTEETKFVAMLQEDVPSGGALQMPGAGKHLVLCGKEQERRTLHFTGAITLNGCTLEVHNLILDNRSAAGPAVTLKNGGALLLHETDAGAITAPAGTTVALAGTVHLGGALSGAGQLYIQTAAVVCGAGNVQAQSLALADDAVRALSAGVYGASGDAGDGAGAAGGGQAELRLRTGKKLQVTDTVLTGEKGMFLINLVNASDELASVPKGTVLVTAPAGSVTQFRTENLRPGTFLEWGLIKQGDNLQTADISYGDGEWSGDYL